MEFDHERLNGKRVRFIPEILPNIINIRTKDIEINKEGLMITC